MMVTRKKEDAEKPQMSRVVVNGKERFVGATDVARWITRTQKFHCNPQTVINALVRSPTVRKQTVVAEIMRKHYPELFVSEAGACEV